MKLRVNAGYVMIEREKVDSHGLLLPYDKREVSRGRVVGMGSRREAMNRFWKWMPIVAAAAITLLVLWFITMDFLALYLLFG